MTKRFRLLVLVGLVVCTVLASAGVVSAQGPKQGNRGGGQGASSLGGVALEAVAKELGISADELASQLKGGTVLADLADKAGVDLQKLRDTATAAREKAQRDAIEQAVTDGKLTRERADWMLQGLQQGYGTYGGLLGHDLFALGKCSGGGATELEAGAKVLGMTSEQLSTQLWGGRTLAQLAEKVGVKLEDVQAAMRTARREASRAAIEQAVTDGKLTREQADWMLQGLDNHYLDRSGRMFRQDHGHRGRPGMKQGAEAPAPSSSENKLQDLSQSADQSA